MQQNDNIRLFDDLLRSLDSHGILQDFIIIGSWALRIYREMFHHDPQVPVVSTRDVDILIQNPPQISNPVDIPELLAKHNLEITHSVLGEYEKFVGPEFEVEFLYVEEGRGEPTGKNIPDLNIIAQPLRYMHYLQEHNITVLYKGMRVRVPEPAMYVLLKYFLTIKRKKGDPKIRKDISTALALEQYLLEHGYKNVFIVSFNFMTPKQRRILLDILRKNDSALPSILSEMS